MERLQKYMARCGVASRRKCEEYISQGLVAVNNDVITELGFKVDVDKDRVSFNGSIISPCENKVYIALNKPEGYITSVKDEFDRKTVIDLVDVKERIFPIGRLDYDTSGLLLLTNDGEVYNKVIHPRVSINKVYEALVKGNFTEEEIKKFEVGVDIGGYITAPAELKVIKKEKNKSLVHITIHEGKNRQVRKMCAAFSHEVITLKRLSVGDIKLKDLPKGSWRNLDDKEIEYLFKLGK
ncbi:pseudouridine synthase [Inconstantimicrobium mannanitabidum]|uniref:Pseudouridine synthase n=1 Tax=Inconstantimicrobium mannanitabidum TaxID=1604901 RepID=A0ACB5RBX8_9CLOT|nr:pseudouridine synthase [Clostridium sp. TW13]GKX66581.1 pseudouridine synthase [Clostridium sp. TW13]